MKFPIPLLIRRQPVIIRILILKGNQGILPKLYILYPSYEKGQYLFLRINYTWKEQIIQHTYKARSLSAMKTIGFIVQNMLK